MHILVWSSTVTIWLLLLNVKMAAHMTYCRYGLFYRSASICRHNLFKKWRTNNCNVTCYGNIIKESFHTNKSVKNRRHVSSNVFFNHHKSIPLAAASFLRFNSTTTVNQVTDTSNFITPPADYIPPPPPIPDTAAVSDIVQSLNALGEPSLESLGLGGFFPPGLVQQGLEFLHASLGLPWWGSIVVGTIILRTIMFPIVIKAQKSSINMMNHMPTVQRLQLKFTQARQRGNMLEAMQYGGQLGDYMKRNNVKPMKQLLMPMCQLPVFLSVFVGLRRMANLPVESMKTGGCLWFTDLTVAEPFYGLPLMTAATFWLTIEAGADGMSAQSQAHIMKWFLRALPLIMLPFITNFPTAMLVYWFTSNTFSLVQVLFLKIPRVRTFFNIPVKVVHPEMKTENKGFIQGFKESYSNMKATQQVLERQRLDEINLRKAAYGPITKTYSYDPKKVISSQEKPKDRS